MASSYPAVVVLLISFIDSIRSGGFYNHPYYGGHPVVRGNLNEAGLKLESLIDNFDPWRPALVRPYQPPVVPPSYIVPGFHPPIGYGMYPSPEEAFLFADVPKPKKASQNAEEQGREEQKQEEATEDQPQHAEQQVPQTEVPLSEGQPPLTEQIGEQISSGNAVEPSAVNEFESPTVTGGEAEGEDLNKKARFDIGAFGLHSQPYPYGWNPGFNYFPSFTGQFAEPDANGKPKSESAPDGRK